MKRYNKKSLNSEKKKNICTASTLNVNYKKIGGCYPYYKELLKLKMELDYKFTAEDIIEKGWINKEDLMTVKTWLTNLNDDYVPPNVQDHLIVLFLMSCQNDVEITKNTILSNYKLKKNAPEIHDDRNINRSDIQVAINTIHLSSIPVRTDEVPIMKVSYMLMDITQEKNPPPGLIVVIDMKGFGLMHMTKLKLGAFKKYVTFLQEGFPMRMKEIHILNSVYFIDKVMALIKVFMRNELIGLIHFHTPAIQEEELFKIIPKKCLPKDYGGDLPSEKELHEITMQQFRDRQEFWVMEEKIRKQSRIWNKKC
ncbi:hypothetical protein JTB14_001468 [Gonioctena quinquepunctata]|nr:hypothetical protein JTB14_001468 [Gonioctena quinquepunctata]